MGLVCVGYHVLLHFQHSIQCSAQISTTLHFKVNSPWKSSCPVDEIRKGRETPFTTSTSCETPMTTPHFFSPHSQQELSLLLVHTVPATDFVTANNKGKIIISDHESFWKVWSSKTKFHPLSLEILKQLCQKQSHVLHFFPPWRASVALEKNR